MRNAAPIRASGLDVESRRRAWFNGCIMSPSTAPLTDPLPWAALRDAQCARNSALLVLALCLGVACSGPTAETRHQTPLEAALALRDEGRLPEAENALKPLAIAGNPAATLALAETMMLRGRHKEALALLQPRMHAEPQNAEVAELLARALDGAGLRDEAVTSYARRLTLVPGDTAAAVRMAELLMARRDYVNADAVAAAGLKLHPDHAGLHVQHARALLARGRVPQALEGAHRATQLAPQGSEGWLTLGRVLTVAGELDMADSAYSRCLAIDPQHPEALRESGALLIEKGDGQKALAVLRRAIQVSPESAEAWNTLAAARQHEHDLTGATAALEQAMRLQPTTPQLFLNLAEVTLEDGQPRRALAEAAKARRLLIDNKGDPAVLAAAQETMIRAIAVHALAESLCHHVKDPKLLQRDVDRDLAANELQASAEEVARLGSLAQSSVHAAVARCSAAQKSNP